MATVFIDLDGTLTKKDTYLPFLFCCIREFGLRIGPTALLPSLLLLYWIGVVTNAQLKEAFLKSVLGGVPLKQLRPVVEKYVAALVRKGLNGDLVWAIKDHLKRGDRVFLVTASFDLYVEHFAQSLSVPNVVCTRAEVRDGIVTGRIVGENCHGLEKVRRLETLLDPTEWTVSILYTDHHSDLPLLRKVSRGFLVNPSAKTRALLKRHEFALFTRKIERAQ